MSKKNLIIIIVSLIIFIAVLIFFDLPSYNKTALLRSEIKKYQNSLKEKEELVLKVNELKEIYDSRRSAINKVYYVLPVKKDVPGLIVQFEALASENGLILESINFSEKEIKKSAAIKTGQGTSATESKQTYKSLIISSEVGGSYQSFKTFLKALEFNVRIMDIKSIDFSLEENEEKSWDFTFNLEIEVYYQ